MRSIRTGRCPFCRKFARLSYSRLLRMRVCKELACPSRQNEEAIRAGAEAIAMSEKAARICSEEAARICSEDDLTAEERARLDREAEGHHAVTMNSGPRMQLALKMLALCPECGEGEIPNGGVRCADCHTNALETDP